MNYDQNAINACVKLVLAKKPKANRALVEKLVRENLGGIAHDNQDLPPSKRIGDDDIRGVADDTIHDDALREDSKMTNPFVTQARLDGSLFVREDAIPSQFSGAAQQLSAAGFKVSWVATGRDATGTLYAVGNKDTVKVQVDGGQFRLFTQVAQYSVPLSGVVAAAQKLGNTKGPISAEERKSRGQAAGLKSGA